MTEQEYYWASDKGDAVLIALPHCRRHRGQGCPSPMRLAYVGDCGTGQLTNEEHPAKDAAGMQDSTPVSTRIAAGRSREDAAPYLDPIAALFLAAGRPSGIASAVPSSELNASPTASPSARWRGRARLPSARRILDEDTHPLLSSARAASSRVTSARSHCDANSTSSAGELQSQGERSSLKDSSA